MHSKSTGCPVRLESLTYDDGGETHRPDKEFRRIWQPKLFSRCRAETARLSRGAQQREDVADAASIRADAGSVRHGSTAICRIAFPLGKRPATAIR